MMYRVKIDFVDLQDNSYRYKAGETYPRSGNFPLEERVKSLLSGQNLSGLVLIEEVNVEMPTKTIEKAVEPIKSEEPTNTTTEPKKPSKTEIMRMPKDELVALATENGLADANEVSGKQLKNYLIEVFGL